MASRAHDRVLFPASGFTKRDAVDYYAGVGEWLLPHLRNRPLSFLRFPGTIDDESFWEKDAPSFTPSWVKRFAVPRRSGESEIDYIVVNDKRTLAWLPEVGGIELHPFLHRIPKIGEATHVVFDLDPGPGTSLVECCEVALLLRDSLAAIGLDSLAKVSGSKGAQVYVPLNSVAAHDATEPFARLVAEELARAHPRLVTAKMAKAQRVKKVFIDWSQNADYKTTVAVYSLRAKRERPYVSMPLRWKEVEQLARDGDVARGDFEPAAALKRLRRVGDLFAPMLKKKQKLPFAPHATKTRAPATAKEKPGALVNGIRLPRPKSQSGRRLFLLPKTEMGNELWLEKHGRFRRWILRPDREGGPRLIAVPAGHFPVQPEYYRATVPKEWRGRVTIDDAGTYETIEGSEAIDRFTLWFTGGRLEGEWVLEKAGKTSWRFAPVGKLKIEN